jgi:hypothetical protein
MRATFPGAGRTSKSLLRTPRATKSSPPSHTDTICQGVAAPPAQSRPMYYGCLQPCDSTSITLRVRELLAILRAKDLENTKCFRRALSFLDNIAKSERRLQRRLAALEGAQRATAWGRR